MRDVPAFPRRLEIEPVSDCNLRCTYCPRHYVNDLKGYMEYELFCKLIEEAAGHPETLIVLHRRGESLLHPRFADMLRLVANRFADVQMATNATLLREELFEPLVRGLNFLSFSLDVPEAYNATRVGANYARVEEKILRFLDYNKGRVRTQASMVRTAKTPVENCELFKEIWRDRVDRVRIYEEHSSDGRFGSVHNPREARKTCVMPFYEMLIYEDGSVGRCNHDWNGAPMGEVRTQRIAEVWHNTAYAELRKQQENLAITDEVCSGCGSWYAEEGKQGTGEVIEK